MITPLKVSQKTRNHPHFNYTQIVKILEFALYGDIWNEFIEKVIKKMQLRSYMLGKIHKARVTCANLNYVGSITIDSELLDRCGMHAGERVLIVDNTNGSRLETYIIEGEPGSKKIEINGAAAHLVNVGDEIIIMTFALSTEPVTSRAILVDEENNFIQYLTETPSTEI